MKNTIIVLMIFYIATVIGLVFYIDNKADGNRGLQSKISEFRVVTDNRGCEYYLQPNGNYLHVGACANPKHYFKSNNQYKYVIDLPEEFPLISTNPLHPDSLTGYISRDTLYIQFLKTWKQLQIH